MADGALDVDVVDGDRPVLAGVSEQGDVVAGGLHKEVAPVDGYLAVGEDDVSLLGSGFHTINVIEAAVVDFQLGGPGKAIDKNEWKSSIDIMILDWYGAIVK